MSDPEHALATALLGGVAAFQAALAVGAVLNLSSRSSTERAVWVPVSATLSALTWRLARRSR